MKTSANSAKIDLEALKTEWQASNEIPPTVALSKLKNTLRFRWLSVFVELLSIAAIAMLLLYVAKDFQSTMQKIYFSFFVLVWLITTLLWIPLRLRTLWRNSDSTAAILDHAWRCNSGLELSGRIGVIVSLLILVFALGWFVAQGILAKQSLTHYLLQQKLSLLFLLLWCGGFTLFGLWQISRAKYQKLKLQKLRDSLAD